MKQTTVNEFKDGLNLDLHPLVTPKTVLTDNLNGTFITYNGNEFCLQNDRGNKEVAKLSKYYIPIGIKEHNGILYIISHNANDNTIEIGTYPGLDWNIPEETENDLNYFKYTPLGNFDSRSDFITPYVIIRNWNGEQRENIEEILTRYGVEEYVDELDSILNTDEKAIYFQIDEFYECWQELTDLNVFEYVMNIPPNEIRNSNPFRTDLFGFSDKYPVTIEVQDSYDGSVNLILVDGEHKSRMINTGFSVLPNNRYKLVRRKQTKPTNSYSLANLDQETLLIRTSNVLTNIDLLGVQSGGQFKGGNYTFYIKFGDADYNQTDVVAESGIVSIFNGNDGVPSTISGTLLDERTDKMINLKVTGLNHAYSKLYIYFSREYSDTQGFRMTEYGMLSEPIEMALEGDEQDIWLTGFEQTTPIDSETLNVDYHTVDWARAEAQHSNMLFLGNVGQKETFQLYQELEDFTLKHVTTTIRQDINLDVVTNKFNGKEYYSTENIYYNLGYWPDEIYRFGVVYILDDGSTTPVFNMCGGKIQYEDGEFSTISHNNNNVLLYNKFGVFLTPDIDIIGSTQTESNVIEQWVKPISFEFNLDDTPNDKVIGWFIVRQKRIPRTICQGLSIGIDDKSHLPLIYTNNYSDAEETINSENRWKIQSFLSYNRTDVDYQELFRELEDLDKQSKSWWKWLLTLASPTLGPIFGMSSALIGASQKLTSELTIDSLKKILQDNKPLLEYRESIINSSKVPDKYYAVATNSNWTNTDINDWNYLKENDPTYKYVDERNIKDIGTAGFYSKEFQIYKYEINEDASQENKYILTPATDSLGEFVFVQYASREEKFPTNIQFFWSENNETIICIAEQNRNSLENLINSIIEYSPNLVDNRFVYEKDTSLHGWGLLSLDPCVNITIKGMLDGSIFTLIPKYTADISGNDIITNYSDYVPNNSPATDAKCVFIPSNTNIKLVDDYAFSNIAGDASAVNQYKQLTEVYNLRDVQEVTVHTTIESDEVWADLYKLNNINLIRGLFCPYIGVADNENLLKSTIYSIRLQENTTLDNLFVVRYQDNSEYYAISKRQPIIAAQINTYRGDCYTNTIGLRILRNFIDTTAPYTENIIDSESWDKYVILSDDDLQEMETGEKTIKEYIWDNINLSDVNTVDLGYWVTFKCLSSYNLGLRSVDTFHTDEMALLGSPRSFYPLNGASTSTGNKMEESFLLNDGLSATVGRKRYNLMPDVPYSKSEFANRIMFSNVHITDAFTNGYRTFQGLSYKDYDKQYGAITKLISLGQNIFVVMEHGLGLVPVNPKALMQTTTGEVIHIYGYGVLPDEMTIISQDYGSKYEHSVIRTPIGIYGIDADARKIWRFSDKQGFETISDMKIETYLKDYLEPLVIKMGLKDIRTHYNGKKGDIMFTWNDKRGEYLYSICYNERQNLWTTRYDWKPIVSENINDEFYSLNFNAWPDLEDENYCEIWDHADDVGYYGGHVSSWYNDHKWFEFEFVVSDPIGVNKIFDNLQIISNNVQPNEMEITVIGDDYEFKRTPVELNRSRTDKLEVQTDDPFNITTTSNIHGQIPSPNMWIYRFDKRLNQTALTKWQPFKDIYKFGRRIGNIQYKEGTWYAQIEPLLINYKKEARIRDKWAKIRIKYYGKDLAIITAIKTLINI